MKHLKFRTAECLPVGRDCAPLKTGATAWDCGMEKADFKIRKMMARRGVGEIRSQ